MHFDGFELCFLACFTATWQLGRPSLAKLLFVEFCGLVFGTAAVFLCRSGIRICFEILLGFLMFYDDHKTVLMNGWIICRFVEISEVSGDFLLDFALNMFLEKFTQLFQD